MHVQLRQGVLYLRLLEHGIKLMQPGDHVPYPGCLVLASVAHGRVIYLALLMAGISSEVVLAVESLEAENDGLVDELQRRASEKSSSILCSILLSDSSICSLKYPWPWM